MAEAPTQNYLYRKLKSLMNDRGLYTRDTIATLYQETLQQIWWRRQYTNVVRVLQHRIPLKGE